MAVSTHLGIQPVQGHAYVDVQCAIWAVVLLSLLEVQH